MIKVSDHHFVIARGNGKPIQTAKCILGYVGCKPVKIEAYINYFFRNPITEIVKGEKAMANAKFYTGRIVATRSIADRMNAELHFGQFISDALKRHVTGDWGVMCKEDAALNDEAVQCGEGRIHSAYIFPDTDEKIWIITESDRSVTTVLYPSEY